MKRTKLILSVYFLVVGTICSTENLYADLIPAENGNFYYKIGGGQDFPMPANLNTTNVKLNVNDHVGLGYNCGAFNSTASITNSLNDVEDGFENIDQNVVQYATSAISSYAMYELARVDPNAFNILNNNLIGAHNLLALSVNSCEAMQNEAAKGENPFTDWVTVSMGNDWKERMASATNHPDDFNQSDVNLVKESVEKNSGNNGVPWIGNQNAGGLNQAPIHVIYDTAIAGYNILMGRSENDLSLPAQTADNAHLVQVWPDPQKAANWIVNVVGDETITTCARCNKNSTPGLGLLPNNQALANITVNQLQQLVSGQEALNQKSLQDVSAPGISVNHEIIRAIQNMSSNEQAIVIGKLGQDIASAKIMDEALLAKRILQTGSRSPEIYSNDAAQKNIQHAIAEFNQEMQDLTFDVDMRRKVVSNTLSEILQNQQTQEMNTHATPIFPDNASVQMQDGAVMKSENNKNNEIKK